MSYDKVAEVNQSKYSERLPVGVHKVVIKSTSKFPTQKKGEAVAVELQVLESTTAKVGGSYSHPFFYNDSGYGGVYEAKQMRSLGVAAAQIFELNTEDKTEVTTPIGIRTQGSINVSSTLAKIFDKKGWATGLVFYATTGVVPPKDGAAPKENPLLNTFYSFVPQTKEDIATMRQKLMEADASSMLDGI